MAKLPKITLRGWEGKFCRFVGKSNVCWLVQVLAIVGGSIGFVLIRSCSQSWLAGDNAGAKIGDTE